MDFSFGNDHVGDSNGDSRLGSRAEAHFLKAIQRLDRALLADCLVAAPDDVGELLLAADLVVESELVRPDLIEDDAAGGCLEDLGFPVSVDGIDAEIGVLEPDPAVGLDGALRDRKLDFGRVRKQWQTRLVLLAARILRQVIATQR